MTLRIGLDAREGFRENPRGIGLYCRHMLRELGEIEGDHEVIAYHEREAPPDLPPLAANIQPRRVPMPGFRWNLWENLRMPWQVRRDRLDVYHGTYNTVPPLGPRWRRVPLVVTVHDVIVCWWEQDAPGAYDLHLRRVMPRVARQAACILTVSEWSKRDICERYGVPPERITVFHNGVHPLFFRDPPAHWGPQARERFAGGRRYLFAIGSPLRRKNTDGFIRALGVLAQRHRLEHVAVITGLVGKDFDLLRGVAAAAGVEQQVRLFGYVTREELIGLYAGADLTVYPSHAEGWGIPVVESLAVGTPVATSRTTAMPEAGGDDAVYFDPGDVGDMAVAIERALENGGAFAARRPAAQARARGFTWRRAAATALEVYRAVR